MTSTTSSRADRMPDNWTFSSSDAARASLRRRPGRSAAGKGRSASKTLKGPTMGSARGKPNASRLITCRRSETEPLTFGSRSASAVQRCRERPVAFPLAATAQVGLQPAIERLLEREGERFCAGGALRHAAAEGVGDRLPRLSSRRRRRRDQGRGHDPSNRHFFCPRAGLGPLQSGRSGR